MHKIANALEAGVSRFFSRENVDKYYDLKKEIGSGNFSIVKLAVNRKTGEEVAVKIIEKKRVGTKKDMLQTEIDILQKVHHPNVVALKELFETSTHIYLVMELVTGGELFDRIVERGSFSEKDAQKVMKQVFEGIDYLHSLGVAHRDLKDSSTDVKITDFGLSKLLPADAHMKMTTACGTPGYVAPEVLKMEGYGREVDLWSCGVIMYIMLCGFPPFYADNNALLFEKIMRGDFAFLSPYWDKISKEAKDLIRRLLTVDATKRLSASQALTHPWFTGTACTEAPVTAETLKKMREYNQSRKAMTVRPNLAPDPTSQPAGETKAP